MLGESSAIREVEVSGGSSAISAEQIGVWKWEFSFVSGQPGGLLGSVLSLPFCSEQPGYRHDPSAVLKERTR